MFINSIEPAKKCNIARIGKLIIKAKSLRKTKKGLEKGKEAEIIGRAGSRRMMISLEGYLCFEACSNY